MASGADEPAEIVWGLKDAPGFPASMIERWRRYLKDCRSETLENAGHSVQQDRPEQVSAAIRRVLERTGPGMPQRAS
jgi:pimeloyl-ACP methyl ester carboxylesterase